MSKLLVAKRATGRAASEVADQAAALRAETDGNPALIGQLLAEPVGTARAHCRVPTRVWPRSPRIRELFFGREEVVAGLLARLAGCPYRSGQGVGQRKVVGRQGDLPAVWRRRASGERRGSAR